MFGYWKLSVSNSRYYSKCLRWLVYIYIQSTNFQKNFLSLVYTHTDIYINGFGTLIRGKKNCLHIDTVPMLFRKVDATFSMFGIRNWCAIGQNVQQNFLFYLQILVYVTLEVIFCQGTTLSHICVYVSILWILFLNWNRFEMFEKYGYVRLLCVSMCSVYIQFSGIWLWIPLFWFTVRKKKHLIGSLWKCFSNDRYTFDIFVLWIH